MREEGPSPFYNRTRRNQLSGQPAGSNGLASALRPHGNPFRREGHASAGDHGLAILCPGLSFGSGPAIPLAQHSPLSLRRWRSGKGHGGCSHRPGKGPHTPRTYGTTWANANSAGGTTSKRPTAFRKRSNSASRIPCAWKLTTTAAFPITIWKNTMRPWSLLQRPRRPA